MRTVLGLTAAVAMGWLLGVFFMRDGVKTEVMRVQDGRMLFVESDVVRMVKDGVASLETKCADERALVGLWRNEVDVEQMRVVACAARLPDAQYKAWLTDEERHVEASRHRGCGRCSTDVARGFSFELVSELSGCDWWLPEPTL